MNAGMSVSPKTNNEKAIKDQYILDVSVQLFHATIELECVDIRISTKITI